MKRAVLFVSCALLALAFGAPARAAVSPSITRLQVPIGGISIPDYICPGQPTEPINVDGTANLVIVSVNGAGFSSFVIHANTQGIQGVGEQTGTLYQFVTVSGASQYQGLPYPFVLTGPFLIELISHGAATNVNIEFVGHLTFTADGTITAFFSNGNVSCE